MSRCVVLLALTCGCLGCHRGEAPAPEGKKMEETILPATDADRARIANHEAAVLKLLRARYGAVQLRRVEADLDLLQRLSDDGVLRAGQDTELEAVGVVFGQVLVAGTQLRWITVEWDGERTLALQYPNTTVIVFPQSMIAKRVDGGERVNFRSLYRGVVDQVEQMKKDPEYKR